MIQMPRLNIGDNGRAVGAVRIINEKLNKMNESVIIQKLIQVGQMLERGELEYSGAEIDTKHYLEQYIALRQPNVVGSPIQLEPVLAEIEHINDLGKSKWYEVVCFDENWRSYAGSKTFQDGEKVIRWKYAKDCL